MIRSFVDRDAEALFRGRFARKLAQDMQRTAQRKLRLLHYAEELRDLASPPGNRLEALKGARRGRHSIRINDRWRICFVWKDGAAESVEIVDYHRG
ncbi:MAG TPA: type II toxin-antitoxin system RelE/ParE family toxin [Alphaproteobacteria bacterium]|nr:type II toxin-antitoxin system RelE/ParE family toxin [Alphaproteobacteria bacterium]